MGDLRRGALLVWIAALTGCPGRLENPERFVGASGDGGVSVCTLSPSSVESDLVRPRCATAQCHDRSSHSGDLDLETPGVAGRLLGRASSTCSGPLVVPNSGGSGFFLEKLGPSPRCGDRMPQGRGALSPAEIACVRGWLASLSTDAGTPTDVPRDVTVDAVVDAPVDARPDVADVPPGDAGDAAMDAPRDATADAGADALDAGVDAAEVAPEAGPDAAEDRPAAVDAAVDATADRPTDTAPAGDAPSDSGGADDATDAPASDGAPEG